MKIDITGRTEQVLVWRDKDKFGSERVAQAEVMLEGFVGDIHAGMTALADSRTPHYKRGTLMRNIRQVSIVSSDELAEIARALDVPEVCAEWLGANLTLSGVRDLTLLPPMSRLFFPDGAVLTLSAENAPCIGPGKAIQAHYPDVPGLASRFPKAARHKRGVVAWVERPGIIHEGDAVEISLVPKSLYRYELRDFV